MAILKGTTEMAGWSLATRVGACGAAFAEDVCPRDGIAGFGGGLLCGSLSTDTDVRRALSFRTGMAQYSQRRLRRPSGHIHHLTSEHGHLPKPILKDTAFMEWPVLQRWCLPAHRSISGSHTIPLRSFWKSE